MSDTIKSKAPRAQRVWLVLYWIGFSITVLLFVVGARSDTVTFARLVITVLAATAALLGALFATRILRLGVSTTAFVKGTTVVRVIAVAWILIALAIWSAAIASTFLGIELPAADWSGGFLDTVGSISIVAILGPGYSEYREAMESSRSPVS